ncbi:hypothetical protein ASPWEDRAFT_35111 [Aspergillus wentii DTO 134E9]|uniref:Nucleic acid-binding protein n=1 Tax=Aspergillus wentii DTO 134E9 TaxID=1073089 RepID=A0A1L9S301_ASPWE|nr:uncharacterized protein ASPWEDRAFT_35111 [Aspergillus wentii DTO 134E9]KAI9929893.1 ssDNA-binding protein, mitochondrial [Aspergillus wentii]OJJ41544.1 hypothetical protein ASPWEDRAFT_35111 [Aspergillus wentii DTO 134E9]
MASFTSTLRPMLRATSASGLSARTFSSSSSRSVARMIITGRLANDPELQATSSGQEIIKYSVASTQPGRDNKPASFFRIASFQPEGAQRDFLLNLPKGTLVYLEGDASIRQWEDADGKRNSALNIVQRSIEVLKRPFNPDGNNSEQ